MISNKDVGQTLSCSKNCKRIKNLNVSLLLIYITVFKKNSFLQSIIKGQDTLISEDLSSCSSSLVGHHKNSKVLSF